jgi:hypothetical protein
VFLIRQKILGWQIIVLLIFLVAHICFSDDGNEKRSCSSLSAFFVFLLYLISCIQRLYNGGIDVPRARGTPVQERRFAYHDQYLLISYIFDRFYFLFYKMNVSKSLAI